MQTRSLPRESKALLKAPLTEIKTLTFSICTELFVFLSSHPKMSPRNNIQTPFSRTSEIILLKYYWSCPRTSSAVHTIQLCNTNHFPSQNDGQWKDFFQNTIRYEGLFKVRGKIVGKFLRSREKSIACFFGARMTLSHSQQKSSISLILHDICFS